MRGAKMVATGSAFSNYNFVSYHGNVPIKKEEYALSFFAPMNAPGVRLICRPSYEFAAAAVGSPFDYPLSSRFDENDAVLVFDDAVIPWENFLINGNLEIASTYHLTGFIWRAMLQGCTRLAVKLDFLAGLFIKALEATGTIEFRGDPGLDRRDPRVAEHVLGADGRDVPQPRPLGERQRAAQHRGGLRLPHPLQHRDAEDQRDHPEPGRGRDDRRSRRTRPTGRATSSGRSSTSSTAGRTTTRPSTRSS